MDPRENQFRQHEMSQQRQEEREAAMRRVQQGEQPWMQEAGVMSVVDAVRDVEFPCTAEQLVQSVGDRSVRTSDDVELPLGYLLPKLNRSEFASIREFESEVLRHWHGIERLEVPPEQGGGSKTWPPGADID